MGLGGAIGRRCHDEAAFWDQALCLQKPQHAIKADPVTEGGDKIGQSILVPRVAPAADLLWGEGFAHQCVKTHCINPVTRIDLFDTFGKEGCNAFRVTHGPSQANFDLHRSMIHPPHLQPYPSRTHPVLGELGAKPIQQPRKPCHHIGMQADRLRQGHTNAEVRGIGICCNGLGARAERLIQPQDQSLSETTGQWRARKVGQIGNPRKANPAECVAGCVVQAQAFDRKMPDPFQQSPVCHDAAAMARKAIGRTACPGYGAGGMETRAFKPGMQIVAQRLLSAEKVRNAGHICHQPIRPIDRHHGCITSRPASEDFERCGLSHQISGAGLQIGADGTGICQGHTLRQSPPGGVVIEAMQVIGIARPMNQGKGPLNGPVPKARVAREPREPDGKQSSCHSNARSNRHKFLICS